MRLFLLACVAALTLSAQPQVQRFTLPNGLRVVHLEDHERPLVRAQIHLQLDPADTPPGREGLPLLALQMLDHSDTAGMKAEEVDRSLEGFGIQLSALLEPGGLEWRLLTRSRDQDRAFGLLADRLLRSVFDPTVLEFQRVACWREEEQGDSPPLTRLRKALVQAPGSRPSLASLGAITLDDLLTFRARVFRPDRAILVLHGDLGLEQAKRLVLLSLGSWSAPEPIPSFAPPPTGVPVPPPGGAEVPLRISAPGTPLRVQAVAVQPGDFAPEAAALLSLLIPGDPALSQVSVTLEGRCLVATLDAGAGAWSLLKDRLEALRQRGFTQPELDRARVAWEAGQALETLHPDSLLEGALAEAQGRRVQVTRLRALSVATLNAALGLWLDPARIRLGVVGDPEALKAVPIP